MDRTGGLRWRNPADPNKRDDPKESVNFMDQAAELKVTNSVGDILALKRSHNQRQFVDKDGKGEKTGTMTQSSSAPTLAGGKKGKNSNAKSRTGYSNLRERPPSKQEIGLLAEGLMTEARTIVVMDDLTDVEALENKTAYHPQATEFKIAEETLVRTFGNSHLPEVQNAKWLRDLVKSNALWNLCEEKSSQIADMVSVTSGDLGAALRKLRGVYRQTHDQMMLSFKHLHHELSSTSKNLGEAHSQLSDASMKLEMKGDEVDGIVESRLALAVEKFEEDAAVEHQRLVATQNELKQTSLALKNLNVIFKTMQADSAQVDAIQLLGTNERLQKDLMHANEQNAEFEKTKAALDEALAKVDSAQRANRIQEHEIKGIRAQLAKRDETIAKLMEKDAIRQAEIEQLQKIASLMNEKEEEDDFQEPPTSVLCVKCKKGLDDLSNIRDAVTGQISSGRLPCQSYRILLPNIGGRRPNRPNNWVRACMRSILVSKMREDVVLGDFRGATTRLPEYVYAYFEREQIIVTGKEGVPQALTPPELATRLDEDRWGFYYGVKALSRDDPESTLFWSLLDEAQGEDGLYFILHVLSVCLSLGGRELWAQYGTLLTGAATVAEIDPAFPGASLKEQPNVVWLHIKIAKEVIRSVFTKAMEKQVKEAIESVEAMCERPGEHSALFGSSTMMETPTGSVVGDAGDGGSVVSAPADAPAEGSVADGSQTGGDDGASVAGSVVTASKEPTHVNLYAYLRFMLGKYQSERTQRNAAVKLMFEAASVGALTPNAEVVRDARGEEHVEYPQFQAVMRTLNPSISVLESASTYSECYEAGNKKVISKVFLEVADKAHLFSNWLELAPVPLLKPFDEDISEGAITLEEPNPYSKPFDPTKTKDSIVRKAESNVRITLGSLVHRSFHMLKPYIEARIVDLPEKWRNIIKKGIMKVQSSMRDAWLKMKKKDGGFGMGALSDSERPRMGMNMDGLQPYIHYQRLLSSVLLIDGFNSNPVLPSELIRFRDVQEPEASANGDDQPPVVGFGATPFSLDIHHAEKLLSTLERSVITLASAKSAKNMPYKSKYFEYDKTRRSLSAMRIQAVIRTWSSDANLSAPVPRRIRMCMRAGYLRGVRTYNAPLNASSGVGGYRVKDRRVFLNPWWAQAFIAEVLALKMNYDGSATAAGRPCMPLEYAITTLSLVKYGTADMVDRQVHDFFLCCRTYQGFVPRLKLFMAFLGFATELDPTIASLLKTETALSRYLDLLHILHMILNGAGLSESSNARQSTIYELFQSNGSQEDYAEEVDVWYVPLEVMEKALSVWLVSIDTTDFKDGSTINEIFESCTRSLDLDAKNRARVDDFCWLVMNQWAKVMAPLTRKANDRLSRLDKKMSSPVVLDQDPKTRKLRMGPQPADPSRLLTSDELNEFMESIHTVAPAMANKDVVTASSSYLKLVSETITNMHTVQHRTGVMRVNTTGFGDAVRNGLLQTLNSARSDKALELGGRLDCTVEAGVTAATAHAMARVCFSAIHDGLGSALDEMQPSVVDDDDDNEDDNNKGPFARAVSDDQKRMVMLRQNLLKLEEAFHMKKTDDEEKKGDEKELTYSALMSENSSKETAEEVWHMLRRLLCTTDQMIKVRCIDTPNSVRIFPLDKWLAGSKLHLEKPKVYSAKLR